MKLVHAAEQWLLQWGVRRPGEAIREAVNLIDHLAATVDAESAGGFYDGVLHRENIARIDRKRQERLWALRLKRVANKEDAP